MLQLQIHKQLCGQSIAHYVYLVNTAQPTVQQVGESYQFSKQLIETVYFPIKDSEIGVETINNPIIRLQLHIELAGIYPDPSAINLMQMIKEEGWYGVLSMLEEDYDFFPILSGDTLIFSPTEGYFNSNFGWVFDPDSADGFHQPEGNAEDYLLEKITAEWIDYQNALSLDTKNN